MKMLCFSRNVFRKDDWFSAFKLHVGHFSSDKAQEWTLMKVLLSISRYRAWHLFSQLFHASSNRKLDKTSMLLALNTQAVNPLERGGDGGFLLNLQPDLCVLTLV